MANLYLIDAPMYVFRAYFALPASLVDARGNPANAVYGYGQFLCGLLASERPTHVAAAFDESLTSSFRNEWHPDYKANRELPPEELENQFQRCKRLTRALGVRAFSSRRFEADDLIATLVQRAHRSGFRVTVVSRDKDLAQLLRAGDRLWDGSDGERIGPKAVRAWLGVAPRQVPDYLALAGDAVDNIPGVPGIGPKAAVALLRRFGSLAGILENVNRVSRMPLRGAARIQAQLEAHRDRALLSLRLATLHTGARIRVSVEDLQWQGIDTKRLRRTLNALGLGGRLEARCLKALPRRL